MPELPEPVITLADSGGFALLSGGDGAAYALRSREDQSTAFFEGEEAAAFVAEYESVKAQYPGYSVEQQLAQLWDQGGYSWMAIPDGDDA